MLHAANAASASSLTGTGAAATLKDHGPLVKTILTQELQLYYTKITEAVLSETEDLRNAGIESIAQDPGIQGLLPYLVEFISDTVLLQLTSICYR
jgi:transcription initiation factor TFIID subunit 6